MSFLGNQQTDSPKAFGGKNQAPTESSTPQPAIFSTMLYENKFLVIKTPTKGEPFVVAEVFTENYSQDIVKSLQEMENAKYQN